MLKFFRFLTLVITPALFLGAWYVIPELLAGPFIRWMSGIITILWGFEFYVFQNYLH